MICDMIESGKNSPSSQQDAAEINLEVSSMVKTAQELMDLIREQDIKMIDFKIVDTFLSLLAIL